MSGHNTAVRAAHGKGYRVQEDGAVRSGRGHQMKLRVGGDGYLTFNVVVPGFKFQWPVKVHRLAAFQLFGEQVFMDKIQVRHLDNNRHNNTPANLALGTQSENTMDIPRERRVERATKAARSPKGRPGKRKLTDAQVIEARRRREAGRMVNIAKEFGVCYMTLRRAVRGDGYYGTVTE